MEKYFKQQEEIKAEEDRQRIKERLEEKQERKHEKHYEQVEGELQQTHHNTTLNNTNGRQIPLQTRIIRMPTYKITQLTSQ